MSILMCEELKRDCPNTWKKFMDYLRERFEFWEDPTTENTLWFCERRFETQLGYFLGFIDEVMPEKRAIGVRESTDNRFLSLCREGIIKSFLFLEKNT